MFRGERKYYSLAPGPKKLNLLFQFLDLFYKRIGQNLTNLSSKMLTRTLHSYKMSYFT